MASFHGSLKTIRPAAFLRVSTARGILVSLRAAFPFETGIGIETADERNKMKKSLNACSLIFAVASWTLVANAGKVKLGDRTFKVADGFTVELVANSPLVDRPIVADFDEEGRLYVADSSGSNDPVKQQLVDRPHRIVRLEDTNGDGIFDKSVVFADKMMFPEGTLWFDGSLYVAAPPSIWKLTDTDDDGIADRREEWFQGKTLTGCATTSMALISAATVGFIGAKARLPNKPMNDPAKPLSLRARLIFSDESPKADRSSR